MDDPMPTCPFCKEELIRMPIEGNPLPFFGCPDHTCEAHSMSILGMDTWDKIRRGVAAAVAKAKKELLPQIEKLIAQAGQYAVTRQDNYDAGVAAERERCATIVERTGSLIDTLTKRQVADAIRDAKDNDND